MLSNHIKVNNIANTLALVAQSSDFFAKYTTPESEAQEIAANHIRSFLVMVQDIEANRSSLTEIQDRVRAIQECFYKKTADAGMV